MFNFVKNILVSSIFPIQCLGCKKFDQWLCDNCREAIVINSSNQTFGHQKISYVDGLFIATSPNQVIVDLMIRYCKYNFIDSLAKNLSSLANDFIIHQKKINPDLNFDLVLPVPLSRRRFSWRGFNQSAIVADNIALYFNWLYRDDILKKVVHTRPQVGLSASLRKDNLKNVFRVEKYLTNQSVLLVDDVVTTGSTLGACAKELKQKGAKKVYCLVISIG